MTSSTKPEVHWIATPPELSQGHRQHAQKLVKLVEWFSSYANGRMDGRTDGRTDRQTYSLQYFASLPEEGSNNTDLSIRRSSVDLYRIYSLVYGLQREILEQEDVSLQL